MTGPDTTDRRAPDQDTAIEEAFVAGTLPEEDRRHEVPTDAGALVQRDRSRPPTPSEQP